MTSKNQVTDGSNWVKLLVKIEVVSSAASPQPSVTPTATPTPAAPPALVVVSGSQTKSYTMADLKALPVLSGYAGQLGKNNVITGPNQYKGVALTDLLKAVGGITAGNSVKITASDGYTKTLTYQQVTTSNFTMHDSITGQEATTSDTTPQLFVAYEKDGAPLDSSTGPLQLAIMTSQTRVTQASAWVKMTTRIEIVTAQ
jgi:hypothetical protein